MQDEVPKGIFLAPNPPDEVFRNKGFRKDPSVSVAQNYVTYVYDKDRPGGPVEYRDGEGIFVYYKGVELPRNGLPYAQAVYAINGVKRVLAHAAKLLNSKELRLPLVLFFLLGKRNMVRFLEKALISLHQVAIVSLAPYYLVPGYYTKTAKEVWKFVRNVLISLGVSYETADKTGEIFAMIFEYDDAYRFPFQDCMSETTKEKLLADFLGEMKRLLALEASRENTGTDPNLYNRHYKFLQFTKLLGLLWYVPSFRKAIREALEAVNHENWQLAKSDVYHSMLWNDYNVRGKTLQERIEEYMGWYGNDPLKLPPRVQLSVQ